MYIATHGEGGVKCEKEGKVQGEDEQEGIQARFLQWKKKPTSFYGERDKKKKEHGSFQVRNFMEFYT